MTAYRIRWAVVNHMNTRERRCLAERRITVLGLFSFYWPVDCDWRQTEGEAERDIQRDRKLREPLPPDRYIDRDDAVE